MSHMGIYLLLEQVTLLYQTIVTSTYSEVLTGSHVKTISTATKSPAMLGKASSQTACRQVPVQVPKQ